MARSITVIILIYDAGDNLVRHFEAKNKNSAATWSLALQATVLPSIMDKVRPVQQHPHVIYSSHHHRLPQRRHDLSVHPAAIRTGPSVLSRSRLPQREGDGLGARPRL